MHTEPTEAYSLDQSLPDPLPPEPWTIFRAWFDEAHARKVQPNPNAMTLATVDPAGRPSARIVLCKGMSLAPSEGYILFFTNYEGRKGSELASNPRAALLFHWDNLDRQVRIEGSVIRSPASESDDYFQSRPLESRLGAWASRQSQPIESRDALIGQVGEVMARFGVGFDELDGVRGGGGPEIPRPPHWGGLRLWADAVELWVSGPGRIHDRARWTRSLAQNPHATPSPPFTPGPWTVTRLQP